MTPQPLTDENIDAVIEASRANLRTAIRAAIQQLQPVQFFEIAKIPLPTGQQWSLVLAILTEPVAKLVAATALTGFPEMLGSFEKMQKPAEPKTSGFSIPGL